MCPISELQECLKNQPIAPIFEKLQDEEKNDENALKFMFIINYIALQMDLYRRISDSNQPKLLHELLGFHSYKSFTYYNYLGNDHFRDKNLQCKVGQCQFFGPYMKVLTHMAINHNKHCSTKLCAYCYRVELRTHFAESSFERCYANYLERDDISDVDAEATAVQIIIEDFYKALKKFAEAIGVCSKRQLHLFGAKGTAKIEQLSIIYGKGISKETIIYQHTPKLKDFDTDKLNEEFQKAKDALFVNNDTVPFIKQVHQTISN